MTAFLWPASISCRRLCRGLTTVSGKPQRNSSTLLICLTWTRVPLTETEVRRQLHTSLAVCFQLFPILPYYGTGIVKSGRQPSRSGRTIAASASVVQIATQSASLSWAYGLSVVEEFSDRCVSWPTQSHRTNPQSKSALAVKQSYIFRCECFLVAVLFVVLDRLETYVESLGRIELCAI